MEEEELQKLRQIELARIKKWGDNLKKVKGRLSYDDRKKGGGVLCKKAYNKKAQ